MYVSCSSTATDSNDIRLLIENSVNLISSPSHHKLSIINMKVEEEFNYPSTYMNGSNRKLQLMWIQMYPWLFNGKSEERFLLQSMCITWSCFW